MQPIGVDNHIVYINREFLREGKAVVCYREQYDRLTGGKPPYSFHQVTLVILQSRQAMLTAFYPDDIALLLRPPGSPPPSCTAGTKRALRYSGGVRKGGRIVRTAWRVVVPRGYCNT